MKKNYFLFILILAINFVISIDFCRAQLRDYPRGMYVDRFFSFSGDVEPGYHTTANIDQNITLLGNEAKENELLQYAKDHHITYLLLYDVHKFIYDLDMQYNGITLGEVFCNFISKAKNQYCIQKIGVAGSSTQFFDDLKANIQTVPLVLTPQEITMLNGNPLIHVQDNSFANDEDRRMAEYMKMLLKIASFNRSNSARFNGAGGGINCSGATIDVITTEIEFWNKNEGRVSDNWVHYNSVVDFMDGIKQLTPGLFTETYLGVLEHVTHTTYAGVSNPVLSNPGFVADYIDGIDAFGNRRMDRLINHYYMSGDFPEVMDVYNPPINYFKQIYHDQRFMSFIQSNVGSTVIQPSFSVENSFYNHNSSETFLGNWFSKSKRNNIWTYEKEILPLQGHLIYISHLF